VSLILHVHADFFWLRSPQRIGESLNPAHLGEQLARTYLCCCTEIYVTADSLLTRLSITARGSAHARSRCTQLTRRAVYRPARVD